MSKDSLYPELAEQIKDELVMLSLLSEIKIFERFDSFSVYMDQVSILMVYIAHIEKKVSYRVRLRDNAEMNTFSYTADNHEDVLSIIKRAIKREIVRVRIHG